MSFNLVIGQEMNELMILDVKVKCPFSPPPRVNRVKMAEGKSVCMQSLKLRTLCQHRTVFTPESAKAAQCVLRKVFLWHTQRFGGGMELVLGLVQTRAFTRACSVF